MSHPSVLARLGLLLLSVATLAGPLADWRAQRQAEREARLLEQADEQPASGRSDAAGPAGIRVLREQAYGQDPKERFDVYLPAASTGEAPLLVMVHGGAWRLGDKAASAVVHNKVQRWVKRGAVLVSLNYPLLPDTDPLRQAQAIARALAVVQSRATGWGAAPDSLILMGHSAGAHLVALLSASPALAEAAGVRRWPATVVLDSAALDLVATMQAKHYGFYDRAFGKDPAYWRASSPQAQLNARARPMLLACSTERRDGPCAQAHALAASAGALGVQLGVLEQAFSHGRMNEEVGLPGPYTEAIERFMASQDPRWAQRLAQAD